MQFKDLEIGQQFKPVGDDRVFTKGAYAGPYNSSTNSIASYAHHNNNFVCFPYEYIILTLQKVTKTEKKWVEKVFANVPIGGTFRRLNYKADLVRVNVEGCVDLIGVGMYYNGNRVCKTDLESPVIVEEDTIVETEEWL